MSLRINECKLGYGTYRSEVRSHLRHVFTEWDCEDAWKDYTLNRVFGVLRSHYEKADLYEEHTLTNAVRVYRKYIHESIGDTKQRMDDALLKYLTSDEDEHYFVEVECLRAAQWLCRQHGYDFGESWNRKFAELN